MPAVRRSAITGAPGAGKSTLLAELAAQAVPVVPEVARSILQSSGGMALRVSDPLGFADRMLDAQLAAWDCDGRGGSTVFDRGFADIVGFLWVEGLAVSDRLDRVCRKLVFDGPVFRARPWRAIYSPDDERIQDWNEAVASDEAVTRAWKHFGYDLIDLPLISARERAAFVLERL
ncbi:AAA family ATPase [Qipengyuania qiaonensis]|uniref:AAA family ATPase n=1 Tax=Qipengyuania qiaonensis TaxID=2867240 RepID=A0ABS7J4H9_9SPHN|nr:AAA family ATPase [Qipengyuania qiaonensis]MBX7482240.1 AAA family ATPase [Qipengyuania qiaonensis]